MCPGATRSRAATVSAAQVSPNPRHVPQVPACPPGPCLSSSPWLVPQASACPPGPCLSPRPLLVPRPLACPSGPCLSPGPRHVYHQGSGCHPCPSPPSPALRQLSPPRRRQPTNFDIGKKYLTVPGSTLAASTYTLHHACTCTQLHTQPLYHTPHTQLCTHIHTHNPHTMQTHHTPTCTVSHCTCTPHTQV